MNIDDRMWTIIQKRLGYTDEELNMFKANPRNADVLSRQSDLMNMIISIEVVEAHGCNSRHKVGEKFYFDGAGNLLVKQCQKNICVHALSAAATLIFAANELAYAGIDPNAMRFKRTNCVDVGLKCGGWGRIVVELHVEEKQ
jgi:uncharacterized repeat protein (TIGR04076 family)